MVDSLQRVELRADPLAPSSIVFEDRLNRGIERLSAASETDGTAAEIAPAPSAAALTPSWVVGDAEASASAHMILVFTVPQEHRALFTSWFVDEHVPLLLLEPEWLRTRIVDEAVAGSQVIAIHSLASTNALTSEFRARAGDTELTRRITRSEWFTPPSRFTFSSADGPEPAASGSDS